MRQQRQILANSIEQATNASRRIMPRHGPRSIELKNRSEVDRLIRSLFAMWQISIPKSAFPGSQRIEFDRTMLLTPLDDRYAQPSDKLREVRCREISLRGVSFMHAQALPHRKVAVAFETPSGFSGFLVTRLVWCRFTREGHYESGGYFVRRMDHRPHPYTGCHVDSTNGLHHRSASSVASANACGRDLAGPKRFDTVCQSPLQSIPAAETAPNEDDRGGK